MFKFVASDGTGSVKRQQAQRACESCRKRKKRCSHFSSSNASNSSLQARQVSPIKTHPQASSCPQTGLARATNVNNGRNLGEGSREEILDFPIPSNIDSNEQDLEAARILSGGVHIQASESQNLEPPLPHPSRFIGDLNPEGIFLAATSSDVTRGVSLDSIGVWLSSKITKKSSPSSAAQTSSNIFYNSSPLVRDVVVPLLEQECLSMMPPKTHFDSLEKIYFDKIHPILPIVDENGYHKLPSTDPARILLQQGICLAASKSFTVKEHLVLKETDAPVTYREFGEKMAGAMRLSIEMGLVTNKIVLVQAFALLSQFMDNPNGEDISSQLSGRAVHYLHTIGLHLQGQQENLSTKLMCCVYAIDRMNAAFNGRPVLMFERDLREDFIQCFEQQEPCFRLLLHVILLLDRVIDLYRPPNQGSIGDVYFPSFEDLVLKCGSSQIGTAPLATIETFYHAVSILSCRTKVWAEPNRSSNAYIRQTLSTSILSTTTHHELHEQLILFPFVPYALSLSLSITYREMRHNKLPYHRTRARVQFQNICNRLAEVEDIYWTASNAAAMGKKMLKEIDRVFSAVSENLDKSSSLQSQSQQDTVTSRVARENTVSTMTNETSLENNNNSLQTPININAPNSHEFDPSIFDPFGMFDPSFDLDGFDACLEGNLNLGYPNSY